MVSGWNRVGKTAKIYLIVQIKKKGENVFMWAWKFSKPQNSNRVVATGYLWYVVISLWLFVRIDEVLITIFHFKKAPVWRDFPKQMVKKKIIAVKSSFKPDGLRAVTTHNAIKKNLTWLYLKTCFSISSGAGRQRHNHCLPEVAPSNLVCRNYTRHTIKVQGVSDQLCATYRCLYRALYWYLAVTKRYAICDGGWSQIE